MDPSTLSALLFEDDTSSESDTLSITNEPVQVVARKKPLPAANINTSRSKRRHEILSLREQVIALQEILTTRTTTGESPGLPYDLEVKMQRAKRWQAVAKSQHLRRRASEAERDRLRRKLKQQRHVIRSVARVIQTQHELRAVLQEHSLASRSQSMHFQPTVEFEDLSSHLPAMLMQLDRHFYDPRLVSNLGLFRDIRVVKENPLNLRTEALESRVVPFDLATTARAFWQFNLVKAQKATRQMEQKGEESVNSMQCSFQASFKFPSFEGKVEGQLASWRIVEPERVVVLQCTALENACLRKNVDSISIRIFQWTVIGRPRSEMLRNGSRDLCQIDTFEVSVPTVTGKDDIESSHLLDVMEKLCIEAGEHVAEVEREGVENLLLQDKVKYSGESFAV